MNKERFLKFLQSNNSMLAIILLAFFLKGVLLSCAFPLFAGQDEARHYNTVQYLAQPKDIAQGKEKAIERNHDTFASYNFSEEIKGAAMAADIDTQRSDIFNTTIFSGSYDGSNEEIINAKPWQPINITQPDVVPGKPLYHFTASFIEKAFSSQSILFRFYLIRIFGVLLGTFAIFLSYLIAKTIGFSSRHALLLAVIIAFQPKFSMYSTNINYDVLFIPVFIAFTLAAVLTLKNGLRWKNITLLIALLYLTMLSKGTGIILIPVTLFLLAFLLYEKIKAKNKKLQYVFYALLFAGIILAYINMKKYVPVVTLSIPSMIDSLSRYLDKSITLGRFGLSSRTYWGSLGWTNSWILDNAVNLIWIIQTFATIGLGLFFFSKKSASWRTAFLPEKKYVVFLLGMIAALQLGIRAYDWTIFNQIGTLDIGTPGRYFLPNLVAHVIVVFVGLGMLFEKLSAKFKSINAEKFFNYSLLTGAILMLSYSMYLIFDVILYRFYM